MKNIVIKALFCFFICFCVQAKAQTLIKGQVIDPLGDGIPGVTVKVKNSNEGTITDLDGNYSIKLPGQKNPVLVFSFIGYQTKEISIGNKSIINVTLSEASQEIDEVVVVGFATQRKVNVTGAVKAVDAKVLASRPITNAVTGLQGAVAGLNITNDLGGAPGQKMNINIRGIGSIGQGSDSKTLVLIDGVEGDLSTINPGDIATISVLKDAASASIYGSRAPNGVILITTKTGEKGISVSYGGNLRIQQPISIPRPVDSYRYALFFNDARTNSNQSAYYGEDRLERILNYMNGTSEPGYEHGRITNANKTDWTEDEGCWANTNWYKVHMKDQTISQEHNMNISGGTEKYNFYISGRYSNQMGLFRYADDKFENYSFSGNFNIKINKSISLNWTTRFINEDMEKPSALDDLFLHNLGRMYPFVPVTNPDGNYSTNSAITNIKDGGRIKRNHQSVYNMAKLNITPLKGWNINFDIANRIENPNDTRIFNVIYRTMPNGTKVPEMTAQGGINPTYNVQEGGNFYVYPAAGNSWYEKGTGKVNYYNSNIRSDYELKIKEHTFKLLGGVQLEYEHYERNRIGTTDIVSEQSPFIPSDAEMLRVSERRGTWSTLGFFGRLNYNYANRYMFEANIRADGASRFPPHKRWGYFPSFSAGWNIAQEPLLQKAAESWLDMLKLRASYGSLGNQNTQNYYPYFQKISVGNQDYVIGGEQSKTLSMPRPISKDITWETVETINVGLDMAFLKNRLSANLDIYQRSTLDMIGPGQILPTIYGVAPPPTNNTALRTRGWEVEVSWRDQIGKDWSYEINASLSDFQQVLTRYDTPSGQLKDYYKDKNLGDIWGLKVIGIAKSDEEMDAHLAKHDQSSMGTYWGGGDFMYQNLDDDSQINYGSGTIQNPGDQSVIGNKTPRYAYSIRGNLTWKFLDFSMFWQGIGKRDFYFNSTTFYGVEYDWGRTILEEHMDYFRYADHPLGANRDSYYARPRTAGGNNNRSNDHYLQDASYLRLKNITIGVSLPSNWLKAKKYVKNLRFYMSAENLLTFTNLLIYDPEAVGSEDAGWGPGKTYPMYRTISFGLNATF